jgi:predicted DNA-binding ribbon-helix-helix protein
MVKKRSITIDGHRTSISLEAEFWGALQEIAAETGKSIAEIVKQIDQDRACGLSTAVRIFIFNYFKK